ncbi:phosphatidate cytidylyltransferase [Gongronella butleri]|nr:phosphatidate cytidylyltransferase [Gongronella butleri]
MWTQLYTRGAMTAVMVIAFAMVISVGQQAIILLIGLIQCKVYQELQGMDLFRQHRSRPQRYLDHALLVICNSWIVSEAFGHPLPRQWLCGARFGCVLAYSLWFAVSMAVLKQDKLRDQLAHFCWQHVIQLYTACQLYFLRENLEHGYVWLVLPCALVICNDIAAYLCGQWLGATPLAALSPKKTFEGFVGAAVITMVLGYTCPSWLTRFDASLTSDDLLITHDRLHGVVLAAFASILAPFGGLFASALKRATGIKDFAQTIPGHGGITDRMDCQLLMGIFTNAYLEAWLAAHDSTSQ